MVSAVSASRPFLPSSNSAGQQQEVEYQGEDDGDNRHQAHVEIRFERRGSHYQETDGQNDRVDDNRHTDVFKGITNRVFGRQLPLVSGAHVLGQEVHGVIDNDAQ